jgi:hypothetical protein
MENIALGFVTFVLFKSFLRVYFWYALQQLILLFKIN